MAKKKADGTVGARAEVAKEDVGVLPPPRTPLRVMVRQRGMRPVNLYVYGVNYADALDLIRKGLTDLSKQSG